ncbi:hypothetical protein N7461_007239 [Penicillium sp. DV-2018c]|nr:hypothetical protein N7461_007239 [Penicillium sp. DV-2018c]
MKLPSGVRVAESRKFGRIEGGGPRGLRDFSRPGKRGAKVNLGLDSTLQASALYKCTAEDLMLPLKGQLDENIDRCIPLGGCGSYGAPFKLTCTKYGYTVIGKGTTSGLWKEVSREAQVYQILRKAQGSAVPVFLGTIDLAKIYFLHGAGQIRHMLVMGWGGKRTATMELTQRLGREIHKSNKEIKALGILHEDLRRDNVLWSEELGRALIIDFHRFLLWDADRLSSDRGPQNDDYVEWRQEMQNVFGFRDNEIYFLPVKFAILFL